MKCEKCGREFTPKKKQTLCIACKYIQTRAKYKAKRDAKKIKKSYEIETCPACNTKFEKRAKDLKYCSDACGIVMENKKLNARWANEKTESNKRAYPKHRKQFDISKSYFVLKKYSACRG